MYGYESLVWTVRTAKSNVQKRKLVLLLVTEQPEGW